MSATPPDETVVRRSGRGWIVGDEQAPDLTSAMVLAELRAGRQASSPAPSLSKPPPRPSRPAARRGSGTQPVHLAAAAARGPRAQAGAAGPDPGRAPVPPGQLRLL